MKKKTFLLLFAAAAALSVATTANAQTTAFTYQGKLIDDCCPASGFYKMRFKLCSTDAGAQVSGTPVQQHLMFVTNGLFTTNLNFGTGSQVFDGSARWLEIEVSTNSPTPNFVTLLPRTELSRTPEAVFAQKAGSVTNNAITALSIASGQVVKSLNGLKDNVTLTAGANVTLATNGNSLQISATGVGGSDAFRVLNGNAYYDSGNVGIGTGVPEAPLHVNGRGEGIRIQGPAPGATSDAYMTFADSVGTRMGYVGDGSRNDNGIGLGSYLGDVVLSTPAGRVLTATASGNVGIGTANPVKNLHVVGPGDVEIGLESGDFGGGLWTIQSSGNIAGNVGKFQIIDRSAEASRLTINTAGNVGIGTTTPVASLQVEPPGSQAWARFITTNSPFGSVIELWNNTPGAFNYLGAINFGSRFDEAQGQISYTVDTGFGFRVLGSDVMNIGAGGVGITGNFQASGNICASGTIGSCSDERFKEQIHKLSGALETVSRLRGVNFRWKTQEFPGRHFSEQPQVGFIAQEVKDVLPEVVTQGSDGFYSVDYSRLTPVLVEAMKEQNVELRANAAKIAALEKVSAEMQTELAVQKELASELQARFATLEKAVSRAADKPGLTFAVNHGPPAEAK